MNDLDTDGVINGFSPSDFVTLSRDQKIDAKTTFALLEVLEDFKV